MAWYDGVEGLDDATTGFIKAQGLDALEAPAAAAKAVVALYNAQSKLGAPAAELVHLPSDMAAPGWATVHERLGVPKDAAAYDFSAVKRADGSAVPPAFVEHVRATAFANKMTGAQAVAFANAQLGFEAKGASDTLQQKTVANQTAVDELKRIHGDNYPVFEFKAKRAAEAMGVPAGMFDQIAAVVGVSDFLTRMYNFGQKMSESDLLGDKGNPGGTPAYTPQEAIARKQAQMNDPTFRQKFASGDAASIAEMGALNRIIHNRQAAR